MEVYFKNFISEESSLEKLVDDLSSVVQGADEYASAIGTHLPEQAREEVATRLNRLKESCQRLKQQTIAGAHATDKMLRAHPYLSLTVIFAAGWLIGAKAGRKR